jgi:hypothetical protein
MHSVVCPYVLLITVHQAGQNDGQKPHRISLGSESICL